VTRPAVLFLSPPTWLTGVGVTRSLSDMGAAVHLLKHRGISPARMSRYCRGTVEAGDNGRPSEDPARDLADLLAAGRRLGAGTVLMPGTDEWAVFVAENSNPLAEFFIFQRPAPGLVAELASKIGMQRLARANGVATPGLFCPANAADAARLADSLAYPVFLKPVDSRPDAWAKGIAHDKAALLSQYGAMEESPEAPNVMFQEYIPGTDEDVWMFDGYFDRDSRCLLGITGQKLRQLPAHMGHCSLGICRQNQAVVHTAVRFLQAVGYQGIVDMGFRFDRRSGEYSLLDVNPRIGGAFRLFVDRNGLDVAKALYLDLTSQEVHAGTASEGRLWLKEDSDLVAYRQYRRLKEISLGSWLGSLRGVDEGATFSWRDPMPFVGTLAQLAGQTIGGRRERLRRTGRPASSREVAAPGADRSAA
jgi:D-aspartate ligase